MLEVKVLKIIKAIRGTLSVAIDTNFHFKGNFQAKYKDVDFVYHWGDKDKADCIISCIVGNVYNTYFLVTEFVSLLSYALDKSFFIRESASDSFRGNLIDRMPGSSAIRMMRYDIEVSAFQEGFPLIKCLPRIDTNEQSNLARLYRMARTLEHINPISSFLFYFHILDYPMGNSGTGIAASYINKFSQENTDEGVADSIKKINGNRVFEKRNSDIPIINKKYDGSLGDYIEKKVRGSVGHIVRYDSNSVHDLVIDSFEQNDHFWMLNRLLHDIVRYKLDNNHGFNVDGTNEIFMLSNQ